MFLLYHMKPHFILRLPVIKIIMDMDMDIVHITDLEGISDREEVIGSAG